MTKDKRGILVYLIGVLALIVSVVSLGLIALDLIETFNAGGSLEDIISFDSYDLLLEVAFAVLELSTGIAFIKQWKKGEHYEIQKSLSQLMMAVAYASFAQILISEFIVFFISGFSSELSVGFIYIGAYLVFTILISTIGNLVKQRKLMNILIIMLIASILAIGFSIYDTLNVLSEESSIYDIVLVLANALIMILTFVFEISSISFYKKNPLILEFDMLGNEDYEVVERKENYEVLKIYNNRVEEKPVHTFTTIIYLLGTIIFMCGIVFYGIEKNVSQLFANDFDGFITNIVNLGKAMSFGSLMELVMVLTVVLIQPLILIGFAVGVIRRDGQGKVCVYSLVALGVTIALFTSLSLIIDFVMHFMGGGKFEDIDFSSYSLWEVGLIVIYIINIFIGKTNAKKFDEIQKGLQVGNSYASHLNDITKISIPVGFLSVVSLAVVFLQGYFEQGAIYLSYPFLVVAILFLMLALAIEKKHPYCEYTIVKRKIPNQVVENKEEIY